MYVSCILKLNKCAQKNGAKTHFAVTVIAMNVTMIGHAKLLKR
jgi:hypothetical protein